MNVQVYSSTGTVAGVTRVHVVQIKNKFKIHHIHRKFFHFQQKFYGYSASYL